jgi:diguanylate cyclase (GGDEF)-like protein
LAKLEQAVRAPIKASLDEADRLRRELAAARARITELEARLDTDPLLDILNRRGFERELRRSLAYVKRYGADAVLIYLDLDGFKSVNDRCGHAAGDELLKAVAAALAGKVRASDVVARLGGDEFAVLMWNVSEAHAVAKARDLEDAVAAVTITRGDVPRSVGGSAGIAALSPLDGLVEAIDAADRAMYVRKRRKQVSGIRDQDSGISDQVSGLSSDT